MSGPASAISSSSPLEQLAQLLGCEWANIERAGHKTLQIAERLSQIIEGVPGPDSDTSVVVHGSVARRECTQGSDLDWMLLVDAQANADHQEILLALRNTLNEAGPSGDPLLAELGLKKPGPEGTFGTLAFSQPMAHYIGGENDSNSNTTRRVLLLLEGMPIGRRREAFDRVRKNILKRYLVEDRGLLHPSLEGNPCWVPLFLLNDFARYWRTMAVDFAYKQFDRGAKGYALRSIKLGTSRKLLYASGLLACFWCDPTVSNIENQEPKTQALIDCLEAFLAKTPLERFAQFFVSKLLVASEGFLEQCARNLFGSYDEFLGVLNDTEKRNHLDELAPDSQDESAIFRDARTIRHKFRLAVQDTFTGTDSPLRNLSIEKGIF